MSACSVPLLDLKAQFSSIKTEIDAAIAAVLESQAFILGPEVKLLEQEVGRYCNSSHAISCASGSDAILLALMALGVGPGDEVVCPSYTFFATAGAISRLGAIPVFADIDPVSYNVTPDSLKAAAAKCKRLKALLPVHLYGQCADNEGVLALSKELGVPFVEDAAQAIGSNDAAGRRAGSVGKIGCFSFFPSKNLGGFGDGGMLTTECPEVAERLRVLRAHGSKPKYYHKLIGINSRLDTLQAAVLLVKLKHLDAWTAARQKNAAYYDAAFKAEGASPSNVPLADGGMRLRTPMPPAAKSARHIYNQYVIRVPRQLRDPLREHLKANQIGNEVYYPVPLHRQDCFSHLHYPIGSLPQSEAASEETLAIPVYPELRQEQLEHVVQVIVSYLKKQQ